MNQLPSKKLKLKVIPKQSNVTSSYGTSSLGQVEITRKEEMRD